MKHSGAYLAISALGLAIAFSLGVTESVQAGHHSRSHVATHHPKTPRGRKVVCYVTRKPITHAARRVCRPVGGYSRLTVHDALWGPAGMPPAPTDFGPHFDFPAHSLNSGPTEAPYPAW
jgi:hypothetical protein